MMWLAPGVGPAGGLQGQVDVLVHESHIKPCLLRQVEKDKRSTEKEVASVRQTIRSLQGVRI